MLTRPLTLNESSGGGRGLSAVTPPPALPLAEEDNDDDEETQTGVLAHPPAPAWSSSSPAYSSSSAPSVASPHLHPRLSPIAFSAPPPVSLLFPLPPPCAPSSSSVPSVAPPPPPPHSPTSFSAPPPVSPLSPLSHGSSFSSAPSVAPPPPCASSSSSAPSVSPLPAVFLLCPPPPPPHASSSFSAPSLTALPSVSLLCSPPPCASSSSAPSVAPPPPHSSAAFSAPPPVSPLSPPPCASSSPSAPSIAPSPPCASSPSSAPSLIPLPPVALLRPPPSSVPPASLFPCAPSSCSPLPPVSFAPCTPPNSSPFSPLPSSSPPLPSSFLPSPPAPRSVPSTHFIPPPLVASFFLRPSCSHPSPLSSSSSSTTPVSSLPPPPPSHLSCLSSSSPPVPSFLHPSPPHSVSVSPSPPCSSAPPLPLLHHHSAPLVSPPPPPPPPPDFFTPYTSAICSPLSPSSSPVSLSPSPPLPSVPVAPSLPPPPPPSPCCPCSSLLPRLLSAHRLEVRRLLRGALASLGRRLDSLERRSRRKRRNKWSRQRGEEDGAGLGTVSFSATPFHSPAHPPHVTTSSSSDSEDSHTYSSVSLSEQRRRSRGEDEDVEGEGRKRRRKNHKGNREEEDEEEDAGRFVGRMAVSFRGGRGAEEEALLTLHKFNHKKHRRREEGGSSQSEKAVSIIRQNGYRVPPLLLPHSVSGSSSQQALHLLQSAQRGRTCSQSEAFDISSGQWRFSDITAPLSFSSNPRAFHLWHLGFSSASTFSPVPMLRLSAVAVETMSESVRGGACVSPLWPLKDWTAPPSLSSDHCYVRSPIPSPTFSARRQQKQRANHRSLRLRLPGLQPLPLRSANGLSAPLAIGQSAVSSEFLSVNGESCKRVSQIRIRRASPRETLLTPMGLPKVKRLKKKEFSLEEIYTNKNYKSPTTNRSLETIFEEPREKDGALLLIGQQRRRRLLLFPDFTQPRKRKRPQGAGLPVAMVPRKRAAARRHCHGAGDDESDLDVMLVERLSALEDFLTRQGLDV